MESIPFSGIIHDILEFIIYGIVYSLYMYLKKPAGELLVGDPINSSQPHARIQFVLNFIQH